MKYGIGLLIISIVLMLCVMGISVNAIIYAADQINQGNGSGTCATTPGCHLTEDIAIVVVLGIISLFCLIIGVNRLEHLKTKTSDYGQISTTSPQDDSKKPQFNVEDIFKKKEN
jgi:hypothetical protein